MFRKTGLRRCATKQELIFRAGENRLIFTDCHIVARDQCVGDPCDAHQPAEIAFVSYCAAVGIPTAKQDLWLRQIPTRLNAKVLMSAQLGQLRFKTAPANELEEDIFQMLATRVAIECPSGDPDEDTGSTARRSASQRSREGKKARSQSHRGDSRPKRSASTHP